MTQGWQIKNIYLYLVCFVTLMMIVFGLISFLNNSVKFIYPVDYPYYRTLMDIEQEYRNTGRDVPSVAELEQIRDEQLESERAVNRAYTLRNLIGSLFVWLIPIPFYLYHWKKIRIELFPANGGTTA
ncbi:MAG: hypothetical protein SCK29_14590 [Bacillota bacterium]|nr:hypothetical protein [Bacillota bacterium]MDW7685329.1 hypothetical protein [Bacillota bacterium]